MLRSNLTNQVHFYPDLSLEISINLPVLRSNVINRVHFYPDLSLETSIDLPVLLSRSSVINLVQFFSRPVFGNFHRFTRVLRSILINTVKLDLPVLRSNLTNRVQFYRDLSLEISIDLPVVRNIIVSE